MGAKNLAEEFFNQTITLSDKEFNFFAKKIYELSGINLPLSSKNMSLVQNRLSRLLRRYKLTHFSELVEILSDPSKQQIEDFISSLTTNKTHFFREEAHFDFLKSRLKSHFSKSSDLTIWCAASSRGHEAYSLAMVANESLDPFQISKTKILATDIDLEILKIAQQGVYEESDTEGLPLELRKKYFSFDRSTESYSVSKSLKSMIDFRRFNLVTGLYKFNRPFDFIFCRNVLIYFDPPTTLKVITNLGSCLRNDGFLFIGHSESGTAIPRTLSPVTQAVYKKVSA